MHALHRPEPLLNPKAQLVDAQTPPARAAAQLRRGQLLMLAGSYREGVDILAHLGLLMPAPAEGASYAQRHAHKRELAKAAQRLLAPVVGQRLALKGAPDIGFLAQLYGELPEFALPFEQVQALNTAWQWYNQGVHLAVLGHKVHPFYGTYAPTRVTHLELFGTWLSQYKGARGYCVDVGTGCGVLAFMLAKAGFSRVLATDNNPNAVESVRRELARMPEPPAIVPLDADLLGPDAARVDVIVFNPPWVQGAVDSLLDKALCFEDGFFERFFAEARARVAPQGRVVMIFSNMIELVQPEVPHPIQAELERGRFALVQRLQRKVKPTPSPSGKRRNTRERVEVWELSPI